MTHNHERESLHLAIGEAFRNLGGRATTMQVFAAVWATLPRKDRDYLARKGLRTAISLWFRSQRPDGLPQAPEANSEGEHVQMELFTATEFRYLIAGYMARSHSNRKQAEKAAARCEGIYGIHIDINNPFEETA